MKKLVSHLFNNELFVRVLFTLCLVSVLTGGKLYAQKSKVKLVEQRTDSIISLTRNVSYLEGKLVNQQKAFDSLSLEMTKQLTSLTQVVASTKESFYNSRIYLWSVIIGAIGLLIVVAGYLGIKSISDRMTEFRADVLQRIADQRGDSRDFKDDLEKRYERFKTEANANIDKGLDEALQKAIEKIVKGSFGKTMDSLNEQLADVEEQLDALASKVNVGALDKEEGDFKKADGKITNTHDNAFEG